MIKRLLCIVFALALVLSLPSAAFSDIGLSNFRKVNEYHPGQFSDVTSDKWYSENVQIAYELGLMNGSGDGVFHPFGSITVAETLAIACRLNNTFFAGDADFAQQSPWYQVYVDYATEHGMLRIGQFANYNVPATRAQFASILASCVSDDALFAINDVKNIPDVPSGASYSEDVFLLYNAGVLTGSDVYGDFLPDSSISRSEVAAIVTRITCTSLRKAVVLKDKPIEVTGISLSEYSLDLTAGNGKTLTATVAPTDASDKSVKWTSSDSRVVSVSASGYVSAAGVGAASVTATAGTKSVSCRVTVKQRVELNQGSLALTLKIPSNGTQNSYAQLIVSNNSSDDLEMPYFASFNGYLCSCYSDPVVPAGKTMTISYYRAIIASERFDKKHRDMYLDNNSTGYAVMMWNGEQYYAEYGIHGITLFYRGNVKGPAD